MFRQVAKDLEEHGDVLSQLFQPESGPDEFHHLLARWLLTIHVRADFLDAYPVKLPTELAKFFHLSPAAASAVRCKRRDAGAGMQAQGCMIDTIGGAWYQQPERISAE
jgi:hypothetical protein